MQLFAFGINHQTAPVSVREQVAFGPENLEQALRDLVDHRQAREAAIISTCNRTEVYCNTPDPQQAIAWLAEFHQLSPQTIEPYLYTLPKEQAVKHAFRVASGLDSMVLGETQILGQIKQAVKSAEQAGTLGTLLNKLFQSTFSVAKEVRTRTEIGANSISMAAAAVRLAQRIYPSIAEQSVLFIGAGEMIELCANHFAAQTPRHMTFANRTVERAALLAQNYSNAHAVSLNDLPEQLPLSDIVITSTASPLPIIGKGMVERAIKLRKHRPIFMVDLAVPRDVEAEVAELDDVFLYAVDDIAEVVQDGLDARQGAVEQAESIITTCVADFVHWMGTREVVPTIRALRDHAERLRRHEMERAIKLLEKGEPPEKVLEAFSQGLINKFLHSPTHALNHADVKDREEMVALISRLYQIHHE
jgi:glutamyl-tRNA reductase